MLCALSVRRLKPGSYDDFRAAWEPDADHGASVTRFTVPGEALTGALTMV